jgi:hypothetical protein
LEKSYPTLKIYASRKTDNEIIVRFNRINALLFVYNIRYNHNIFKVDTKKDFMLDFHDCIHRLLHAEIYTNIPEILDRFEKLRSVSKKSSRPDSGTFYKINMFNIPKFILDTDLNLMIFLDKYEMIYVGNFKKLKFSKDLKSIKTIDEDSELYNNYYLIEYAGKRYRIFNGKGYSIPYTKLMAKGGKKVKIGSHLLRLKYKLLDAIFEDVPWEGFAAQLKFEKILFNTNIRRIGKYISPYEKYRSKQFGQKIWSYKKTIVLKTEHGSYYDIIFGSFEDYDVGYDQLAPIIDEQHNNVFSGIFATNTEDKAIQSLVDNKGNKINCIGYLYYLDSEDFVQFLNGSMTGMEWISTHPVQIMGKKEIGLIN